MDELSLPVRAAAQLVERADQLLHMDGARAVACAKEALATTADAPALWLRGRAWWHVALSSLRLGHDEEGTHALGQSRAIYAAHGDRAGLLMCDDLDAMQLRARGLLAEAMQIHDSIQAHAELPRSALDRYITLNSRGLTRSMLGQTDETLLEFYAARAVAEQISWPGPRLQALLNLSAVHANLYNLHEARLLSCQAFEEAEALEAWTAFGLAGLNLLLALDGMGEGEACGRVVARLLRHRDRLPDWMLPRNLTYVAMAYLAAGDLAEARRWLDQGEGAVLSENDSRTDYARVLACYFLKIGDPQQARAVCQARLLETNFDAAQDQPYPRMRLLQAAADACEQLDDTASALAYVRQVQALYEGLVAGSSRAGAIALQAAHELTRAQEARQQAEMQHAAVSALNAALEAQIEETRRANESLRQKIAEADALQQQLREQALRDPLTGVYNRRFLMEVGEGRLQAAHRASIPVCVVLLDVDRFKQINDTHGHEGGDQLLVALADLASRSVRRSDVVCRLGGEEFLLLLDHCAPGQAIVRVTELLAAFRRLSVDGPAGAFTGCTFSAGVAALGVDGIALDGLTRVADERMYRAKAAGRACIFGPPEV